MSGDAERWHLGLLTDDDRYVGLEQAAASAAVDGRGPRRRRGRAGAIRSRSAATQWQTWSDEGGDLALVRETAGTTTLVVGHLVPEA